MTEPDTQSTGGWLDSFVEYVKQAIDIIQLKADAIDRARGDEEAFTMGLVIIALGGVGAAIGSFTPLGVVFYPVLLLVGAFVGAAVLHLLATVAFGGDGEFMEFFRPFSLAYILTWVNVVWVLNVVLSPLAGLWICVVAVVCVERNYGLDRTRAIATVAIPLLVMLVLSMMFFAVVGMALLMSLN
jgi:hypothetical protein